MQSIRIETGPSAICLGVQYDLVVVFVHIHFLFVFLSNTLFNKLPFCIYYTEKNCCWQWHFLHSTVSLFSLCVTFSLAVFSRWPEQHPSALCPCRRHGALQLHAQSGWGEKPTCLKVASRLPGHLACVMGSIPCNKQQPSAANVTVVKHNILWLLGMCRYKFSSSNTNKRKRFSCDKTFLTFRNCYLRSSLWAGFDGLWITL